MIIGVASAQPGEVDEFHGEIGTLDTQVALHLSRGDIVGLQDSLVRLGFLAGDVNGVFDDRTQSALAAWQRARGLAPTGHLANLQWAALRGSGGERDAPWRREIGTTDLEATLALRPSDIASIQTTLLRLRILRQAPTGTFDENTRRALAYWQHSADYEPTGHLGPQQWAGLRKAAPLAPALEDVQRELGTVFGEDSLDLTPGEIKTVQDRLCVAKDLRGPISGELDDATRSALIKWQQSELVTATGYLGPLQFDTLLASTPRSPDGVVETPCNNVEVAAPSSSSFQPTAPAPAPPRLSMQPSQPRAWQKPWVQPARFHYGFAVVAPLPPPPPMPPPAPRAPHKPSIQTARFHYRYAAVAPSPPSPPMPALVPRAWQKLRIQTARFHFRHTHPLRSNPDIEFYQGIGEGLVQEQEQEQELRSW